MHHAEVLDGRGLDNTQWESVLVVGRQQCAQLGIFGKTFFCQYLPQKHNCQAWLLLISAQISKFNYQILNSEIKGAELTL